MAEAKAGNLAAVKTLLRLGVKNVHQCCYADDRYDNSAVAAAHRKGQTAAAALIENYKPGNTPSLFELAAQRVVDLAVLPEAMRAAAADCI
jgi:hypothetical protein